MLELFLLCFIFSLYFTRCLFVYCKTTTVISPFSVIGKHVSELLFTQIMHGVNLWQTMEPVSSNTKCSKIENDLFPIESFISFHCVRFIFHLVWQFWKVISLMKLIFVLVKWSSVEGTHLFLKPMTKCTIKPVVQYLKMLYLKYKVLYLYFI